MHDRRPDQLIIEAYNAVVYSISDSKLAQWNSKVNLTEAWDNFLSVCEQQNLLDPTQNLSLPAKLGKTASLRDVLDEAHRAINSISTQRIANAIDHILAQLTIKPNFSDSEGNVPSFQIIEDECLKALQQIDRNLVFQGHFTFWDEQSGDNVRAQKPDSTNPAMHTDKMQHAGDFRVDRTKISSAYSRLASEAGIQEALKAKLVQYGKDVLRALRKPDPNNYIANPRQIFSHLKTEFHARGIPLQDILASQAGTLVSYEIMSDVFNLAIIGYERRLTSVASRSTSTHTPT